MALRQSLQQADRGSGRAYAIRARGLVDVLRHVHDNPATTRADLARELGLSRGSATEIAGRLRALSLIDEIGAAPTGSRGRPTRVMTAHPAGPVVGVIDISHERWRLASVALGGELTLLREEHHVRRHDPVDVLAHVAEAVHHLHQDLGPRLRAFGVSVAGTVSAGRLVLASGLGWQDVDIAGALDLGSAVPVVVGNDATLSGVAEARRGAGRDAVAALHLTIEVGVGGVLMDHGRPVTGRSGAAGEFGHLPFGDPARPCACGAYGCWDAEIDGRAMARHLDDPVPDDPRTAAGGVLARATAGDQAARTAVTRVARDFGHGVAGLVNALDPDVITLSGLAVEVLDIAGPALHETYRAGLMRFRRHAPPPLLPARFPTDGSLRGAAELAFDEVLSETGLHTWRTSLGQPT